MDGPLLQYCRLQHRDHSKANWATVAAWNLPRIVVESIMVRYFKNIMGVVVFAKAQGQVQLESSWTLPFLGLLDFTGLRTLVKTNTPINTINALSQICNFLMATFLYQTNSHCNTYFIFFNLDPFEPQCNIQFPSSPPTWVLVELQTF